MKVAVVGCGMIAREHLRSIRECPGARIVGLADRNADALEEMGREFGIRETFPDARELLEKAPPDVVHITTPPATHATLVRAALDAGCHVYVEKPFTLHAPEAEELVELASAKHLKICVGYMHLFDAVMLEARRLVDEGALGSLCGVESYYGFDLGGDPKSRYFSQAYTHWAYKLPGGLLMNGLDHPLSLAVPFLPRPKRVLAAAAEVGVLPKRTPDELRILLADERLLASVTLSEAASPRFHYLNLLGSKATLQVDLQNKRIIRYGHREGIPHFVTRALMNVNQGARILAGTVGTTWGVLRGRFTPYEGMRRLVAAFYRAIETGAPSPVPPEWAVSIMSIMDRVWEQIGEKDAEAQVALPVPAPRKGKKTVLVTGGTGFIGRHLVRALLERKESHVRVLARSLEKAEPLRRLGAEIVLGNLFDEESLRSAVRGVDAVYHLGATMGGKWSDFLEGTVKGTARLVRAARQEGVRRFVFASTIAVYGAPSLEKGRTIDEQAPTADRDLSSYIRSKIEAERILLREVEDNGFPATILRLGVVYGPGKGISRIGYAVKGRTFVKVGLNNIRLPSVYVDNAVEACLLAGGSDKAAGQIYNVVDDVCFTQLGYLRERGKHQPTRWVFFPYGLARLMGAVARRTPGGLARRVASYLSPFHLRTCAIELLYDNSKMKRELGWSPDPDLKEHLRVSFTGDTVEGGGAVASPAGEVELQRRSA